MNLIIQVSKYLAANGANNMVLLPVSKMPVDILPVDDDGSTIQSACSRAEWWNGCIAK